jgi:hypothetical protein
MLGEAEELQIDLGFRIGVVQVPLPTRYDDRMLLHRQRDPRPSQRPQDIQLALAPAGIVTVGQDPSHRADEMAARATALVHGGVRGLEIAELEQAPTPSIVHGDAEAEAG